MDDSAANVWGGGDLVTRVAIDEAHPNTLVLTYAMLPPPPTSPPATPPTTTSPPVTPRTRADDVVWPAPTVLAGTLDDLREPPKQLGTFTLTQENPVARLTFEDAAEPTTPQATFALRRVPQCEQSPPSPPPGPAGANAIEWVLWCSVPVAENGYVKRKLGVLWFEPLREAHP